jgi:hypothetical protein
MGWPAPHPGANIAASQAQKEIRMRTKPIPETAAFGIDIGKKVFHVVAMNAAGSVIQRTKFSRDTLMTFFEAAPRSLIGMEACPGSQLLA